MYSSLQANLESHFVAEPVGFGSWYFGQVSSYIQDILGPKLLLPTGCVKLGNQFAVCSPKEGR